MATVRSSALALFPLALFCGCVVPTVPNVVLIVIDTLRADHIGAYGTTRATTTFRDQHNAEGVVFEGASAASSYTSESLASRLTGSLPSSAGAVGSTALPGPDTVSLALRPSWARRLS
jgi:arylsulfatase A-like enzyme